MNDPIVFSDVARAVFVWLASPTFVILFSLSYLAFTLARIVSHATATERKENDE